MREVEVTFLEVQPYLMILTYSSEIQLPTAVETDNT